MVKVIKKADSVHKIKSVVGHEEKCPFDDGDLIRHGDNIYLVNKCKDGYYCVSTDTVVSMKKIKPKDWSIFTKI